MVISVHIPRTAGSSFRAYLRGNTQIRLHEDYGNPILVPSVIRNSFAVLGRVKQVWKPIPKEIDCLHGHFLPIKYKHLLKHPDNKFITWLREPAERIRSQYDYCFQSDKAVDRSPFQNKVARENWSFEAFYQDGRMQNLYTKFFWKFPLGNFHFIGIVEHYENDFKFICENIFQDHDPKFTYGNRTRSVSLDPEVRAAVKKHNKQDYILYQNSLALRERRIAEIANT